MLSASLLAAAVLTASQVEPNVAAPRMPDGSLHATPNLRHDIGEVVLGDLWRRPGLSQRDRSLVTVAAIITEGRTNEMDYHFKLALDSGVTPQELAGVLSHLMVYAGVPFAAAAHPYFAEVLEERGVDPDTLVVTPATLPLDPSARAQSEAGVRAAVGGLAPAFADYTNDFVNGDLWLREDLSPRDRSLVTVSSLITAGHLQQLPVHVRKGVTNGLTRVELSETVTHLGFYAGWPRAYSAVPIIQEAVTVEEGE